MIWQIFLIPAVYCCINSRRERYLNPWNDGRWAIAANRRNETAKDEASSARGRWRELIFLSGIFASLFPRVTGLANVCSIRSGRVDTGNGRGVWQASCEMDWPRRLLVRFQADLGFSTSNSMTQCTTGWQELDNLVTGKDLTPRQALLYPRLRRSDVCPIFGLLMSSVIKINRFLVVILIYERMEIVVWKGFC